MNSFWASLGYKSTTCILIGLTTSLHLTKISAERTASLLIYTRSAYLIAKKLSTSLKRPRHVGAAAFHLLATSKKHKYEIFSLSLYEIDQELKAKGIEVPEPLPLCHKETKRYPSQKMFYNMYKDNGTIDSNCKKEHQYQAAAASCYIARALLEDIQLALQTKMHPDPLTVLPGWLHEKQDVFIMKLPISSPPIATAIMKSSSRKAQLHLEDHSITCLWKSSKSYVNGLMTT